MHGATRTDRQGRGPALLFALLVLALAAGLFGAPPARADFSFIKKWGALGAGDEQLNAVQRVAVSPGGDVYVTESGNQRVQRFDSNGNFVGKWGNPGPAGSSAPGRFSSPRGIAIGSDLRVYVVDSGNDRVEVFTPEGVFIRTFGSEGPGSGQLSAPEGIATDAAGNVYVADFGNARVQKFTRDGAFVTGWGSSGTGPGQFSFLEDVAVAPDGSVYTVESDNRRVQHFSSTGQALGAFGTQGAGPGAFESPKGIATDASGSVYVADSGNDNVQRFTGSGTPVQKAPRVSIAGRRRVARGRRLTLTVRATDAKGLARVVVSIDRKRSKLIAGRGRKAVTYRIVFRSGRHKVRAGALDTAGNAARSVSVRVRVG